MGGLVKNMLIRALPAATALVLAACAAKAPQLEETGEASNGGLKPDVGLHQQAEWRATVDELLKTPPDGNGRFEPLDLSRRRTLALTQETR